MFWNNTTRTQLTHTQTYTASVFYTCDMVTIWFGRSKTEVKRAALMRLGRVGLLKTILYIHTFNTHFTYYYLNSSRAECTRHIPTHSHTRTPHRNVIKRSVPSTHCVYSTLYTNIQLVDVYVCVCANAGVLRATRRMCTAKTCTCICMHHHTDKNAIVEQAAAMRVFFSSSINPVGFMRTRATMIRAAA